MGPAGVARRRGSLMRIARAVLVLAVLTGACESWSDLIPPEPPSPSRVKFPDPIMRIGDAVVVLELEVRSPILRRPHHLHDLASRPT